MNSVDLSQTSEPERHACVTEALTQGEELRKAKKYDRGIDVLVEALQYGVDKTQIYFRLGNVYFDAGKLDHAEYAYRRAIDEDPNHANAHHNLSVVVRNQGRISEAIRLRRHANRLAMKNSGKVQLDSKQAKRAKHIAHHWLITAGIILGILVFAMILLSR